MEIDAQLIADVTLALQRAQSHPNLPPPTTEMVAKQYRHILEERLKPTTDASTAYTIRAATFKALAFEVAERFKLNLDSDRFELSVIGSHPLRSARVAVVTDLKGPLGIWLVVVLLDSADEVIFADVLSKP